ncbi:MAG: XRE family transcriptional regulator [Nitrospirae bacterium]|nr:MAG: XRE family transcriptional regulator [Nitrospirota bacterium]
MSSSSIFKSLRSSLELSQEELASLLSMRQSTLSNYETGKRKPSLRVCYKIIRLMQLKNIKVALEDLRPEE